MLRRTARWPLFFLLVAPLLACAGSAPERNLHLLRAEPVERSGRLEAPVEVSISMVTIAPYLEHAGLVVETESGQIRPARRHEWAEPLAPALRSLLRDELSQALGFDVSARNLAAGSTGYVLEVYVDRLHGSMAGTVQLDASYRIQAPDGEAVEYRFATSRPQPREGYDGMVEAQVALVQALAVDMARALEAWRAR